MGTVRIKNSACARRVCCSPFVSSLNRSAQFFARKRANVLQMLLNFGAPRMQNLTGLRRVRWETRTTSAQFAVPSVLRLAARLRDVVVSKSRKFSRENARTTTQSLFQNPAKVLQNLRNNRRALRRKKCVDSASGRCTNHVTSL